MTPSRFLLYLCLGWALLGAAAGQWPFLFEVWAGLGLAGLGLACADVYLSRKSPRLEIERDCGGVWPVGVWHTVQLTLHNRGRSNLHLQVIDDYPTQWQMEGLPHQVQIAGGRFLKLSYRLRPSQRGDAHFGAPYLRLRSPFGLWLRLHRLGASSDVKVFPDFSKLLGHTLNATDRRTPTAGTLRKRRRGEGTDFRQLREYRSGDSQRAIDWKGTARQQKLISREYQEERDQQVVFLLDTGRRMLAKDDVTSHFDHALNAVLTLSFLAQKQGDAVGLMSFGGNPRWLAPHKGRAGLDRLLAGVYDLHAQEVAPDYLQAASNLMERLRKRAFVVIITNLRDEDDAAMRTACELLSQRHLVMCASLREKSLDLALQNPVQQFEQALRFCASSHFLAQREEAIRKLGIRAGHLIDITPENLSMALVNRYLDIKESGVL
jgi:uncharacterized protein (DUF58 family)